MQCRLTAKVSGLDKWKCAPPLFPICALQHCAINCTIAPFVTLPHTASCYRFLGRSSDGGVGGRQWTFLMLVKKFSASCRQNKASIASQGVMMQWCSDLGAIWNWQRNKHRWLVVSLKRLLNLFWGRKWSASKDNLSPVHLQLFSPCLNSSTEFES